MFSDINTTHHKGTLLRWLDPKCTFREAFHFPEWSNYIFKLIDKMNELYQVEE